MNIARDMDINTYIFYRQLRKIFYRKVKEVIIHIIIYGLLFYLYNFNNNIYEKYYIINAL